MAEVTPEQSNYRHRVFMTTVMLVVGTLSAVTSGWVIRDLLTQPRSPVKIVSMKVKESAVYAGDSLIFTMAYYRYEECPAQIDHFILTDEEPPVVMWRRSVPAGYTKKTVGDEPTQAITTIPVPMGTPWGSYRTLHQRLDYCRHGVTGQQYGEVKFKVLPTPAEEEEIERKAKSATPNAGTPANR